ncbi:hypothetical protein TNCV_3178331 [Trichonephila clavipes]|nr:hypothetical protein TNCV_3178331 [Trichonephila clavipes]
MSQDLFSDYNTLHFVISTDSSISYKRNCKILTIWNKFQDLTTNSLPVNPRTSNREEIDQAILNFNSQIHIAVNQASKFKPIIKPMTNDTFENRLKIRGKTAYASFGKELNALLSKRKSTDFKELFERT